MTDNRDRRKIRELNRYRGIPNRLAPDTCIQRINLLRQTMSWTDIATRTGTSAAHLRRIASGKEPQINRLTQDKVLAVQPTVSPCKVIEATGSVRRVRALQARGHSQYTIAEAASSTQYRISCLAAGQTTIRVGYAQRIAVAYEQLAHLEGNSTRGRNNALHNGWAPPITWDDDTIDDPSAHPDWTGHCGTDRGWWLHRANNIPTCQPCQQAHDGWRDQHKHLDHKQRWAAASKARAAAASRGIAIAANARELFAQGYTTDQAALRLGVGRDRIEQELRRHPNATNELEVAA